MLRLNDIGRLFDNTYRVEFHKHENWEVVYYTDGNGVLELQDQKIHFEKNDIFVIPPGTLHTDYAEHGFKNYHYTCTDFDFAPTELVHFQDNENLDFLRLVKQMYTEYHLKRKNWRNIVDSLNEVLYQYILSFTKETAHHPLVSKAITVIIANLSNPRFDMEEMLSDIPLHRDYFRRLFTRATGMTPLQFLTAKRISYAQQLLSTRRESGLSVKEIAFNAGFTDPYYFSRVFKKATGCAPTEWQSTKKLLT